jgi:hypothetical protein
VSPSQHLKRVLRVLVLGPMFLIAGAGLVAVEPIVFLIEWISGAPRGETRGFYREFAATACREVWYGYER